jgi:hypothetical protein
VVVTLNVLVGRREGSWAANPTSDLITQYLGYRIFLSLGKRLPRGSKGMHAFGDASNLAWSFLGLLEGIT